jgi:hypothetical protein
MMVPLLRENTHLTVHSKGRMETIRTSHITQIRTSQPAGIAGRRPPAATAATADGTLAETRLIYATIMLP